ncbi:acyl-CoA reductase [Mucilaginibacter sp. SMC90]|uniref:acyl-CoA reductase n=1 Tax=Mucilaginibacter sp. SMC90 TaxID=2929803 RepID=UPI001FB23135|nr:acyl-CoA reductase [Mucilaginibacter sp. SMC90]UOE51600.1 acyl-CoA reductase [Mucilaginibacter sp. SMC90]
MSKINPKNSINSFSELGRQLLSPDTALNALIENEQYHNAWFTPASVSEAVTAIGNMLNEVDLSTWLSKYDFETDKPAKNVGLILAGNIPLVGFHDVLCVIASGNKALIKASSQDARLIKAVLEKLVVIDPAFADTFSFVDRLQGFDAIIATGSNNSSRYFDYYFGKVPNIIRKNRNSIAVLSGKETADDLFNLGHDILDYYGLGCRNVSKILVPEGYDFTFFFESIEDHKAIINHHKYNNNYDYNKSIYLVNSDKHLDNGFLMVKEDDRLTSPLSALFFNYYHDMAEAENMISQNAENIQCIVSTLPLHVKNQVVGFGQSQQPKLWDYADGVDTMEFLSSL